MCLLKNIYWSTQETLFLAHLRLHPLHLDSCALNGLTALPARDAWDALVEYGESQESASMGAMIAAKCNSSQEHIKKLERIHLLIHCPTGTLRIAEGASPTSAGKIRFEIPLLFVEIGCGYDPISGKPVIVVTDPLFGGSLKTMLNKKEAPSNTWLFPLTGQDSDLQAAVLETQEALSRHGAASCGFEKLYRLDSVPTARCNRSYRCYPRSEDEKKTKDVQDVGCLQGGQHVVKFVLSAGASATVNEETTIVRREVSMLVAAQGHPNISTFYGLFECDAPAEDEMRLGPKCWGMVLETCERDLFEEATRKPLDESMAREVTYGVLSALQHIHARGVVHRDVKPENVLLAPCGRVVLSSFAIAARVTERQEIVSRCGSQSYVAPEVLLSVARQCGTKMDIFGLGATLYFALCGKLLFNGSSLLTICKRTVKCKVEFVDPAFAELSAACLEFVRNLLLRHPRDRPCATEALASFWISSSDGRPGAQQGPLRGEVGEAGARARPRRRSTGSTSNTNSEDALLRLMSRSIAVSDGSEFDIMSQTNAYASICSGTTAEPGAGGKTEVFFNGNSTAATSQTTTTPSHKKSSPLQGTDEQLAPGTDAESAVGGEVSVAALKKTIASLQAQKMEAVQDEDYLAAQRFKKMLAQAQLSLEQLESSGKESPPPEENASGQLIPRPPTHPAASKVHEHGVLAARPLRVAPVPGRGENGADGQPDRGAA